jgi:hypothetical protein
MDIMTVGTLAPYKICNVSGTQFQLGRSGACTTIETFSSTGTAVSILFMPASGLTNGFIVSNTGWPSGTVLTWGNTNGGTGWLGNAAISGNGNPINTFNNQNSMILKVDIPTSAAPGDYTINIVDCTTDSTGGTCGGLSDTLTFTITVTALVRPSDANEATSFPAISSLSTWVSYMTNSTGIGGGGDWCNGTTGVTKPTNQLSSIGLDTDVEFYDGGLSYWRVGTYLNTPGWKLCTANIQQQMGWGNAASGGVGWVLSNDGRIHGYDVFPVGFEMNIAQDPRSIAPLQYLAGAMSSVYGGPQGNPWVLGGCNVSDALIREDAYALDLMLALDRLGLTPVDYPSTPSFNTWKVREQRCADALIGILNAYLEPEKRFNEDQFFMCGLTMDSLIHWWQATKDPRVPMVVKATIDYYYSKYNLSLHIAMWDPEPNGVRCLNSSTWYRNADNDGCQEDTVADTTVLHNLVSHAFAWYWRISGDDTYRTEGDEVFNHALDGQDGIKGKTWSQLYRYSFNYVGWRQGWLSPERSIE